MENFIFCALEYLALTIVHIDLCSFSASKLFFNLQKSEKLEKQDRTAEKVIITLKNEKEAQEN